MNNVLTADQMRRAELAAMQSGVVTGLELMERAGQGVVDAILQNWPHLKPQPGRALILCGPGNNGGDGFVIARLLNGAGWSVDLFLLGEASKLPPDAKANYDRLPTEVTCAKLSELDNWTEQADICIDALFGTGLTRPLSGQAATAVHRMGAADWPQLTVAVDAPSGLCMDSGKRLGGVGGQANLTVTFHSPKIGHYIEDGPSLCGRLVVVDIGLPSDPVAAPSESAGATEPIVRLVAPPAGVIKAAGNKFTHGHAVVVSGPPAMTGAARLAARGALRIGAGLVTIAASEAAIPEHAAQINAIMLRHIGGAQDLVALLEDPRITALCVGPGLGLGAREADIVAAAVDVTAQSGRALVLDADALTHLSRRPDVMENLHANCVLTPHGGEFKRLFPDIAEALSAEPQDGPAYSKVDATRAAARRAGCTVLFKGADTVIAGPDGSCSINASQYDRSAPWLATAGSGDVLAGFIAGLMARGFDGPAAAAAGAWLHTECALSFGPGLIAEDLSEELPKVLRRLNS